jgi:hypothetical protein
VAVRSASILVTARLFCWSVVSVLAGSILSQDASVSKPSQPSAGAVLGVVPEADGDPVGEQDAGVAALDPPLAVVDDVAAFEPGASGEPQERRQVVRGVRCCGPGHRHVEIQLAARGEVGRADRQGLGDGLLRGEHLQPASGHDYSVGGVGRLPAGDVTMNGSDALGQAAALGGGLALRGHRWFDVDHDHVTAVCPVHGYEPASS